jgi:hypothetical protein
MSFLREYKKLNPQQLKLETGQYSVLLGSLHSYLDLTSSSARQLKTDRKTLRNMIEGLCHIVNLDYGYAIEGLAEIFDVPSRKVLAYMSRNTKDAVKKLDDANRDVLKLRDIAFKSKNK